MYILPAFRLDDARAWGFVGTHDFGLLLSQRHGAIEGTHLARANPHWQGLDGAAVTVVFEGAHGPVSPTWYGDAANAVPSWTYTAVHVVGTARLGGRDDLVEQLEGAAAAHEPAAADGTRWHIGRLASEQRERLFAAIVPVVIDVERVEGKAKPSQNPAPPMRTASSPRSKLEARSAKRRGVGRAGAGDAAAAAAGAAD